MSNQSPPRWRLLAKSNPEHYRKRAKRLLKAYREDDAEAGALFADFHPERPAPATVKLADAQLVLARAHDFASWPRFQRAITLYNAILADDVDDVLAQIRKHPRLLRERVNGSTSNWGPPLVCAAQVGARRVFEALLSRPDQNLDWALDRAILKGRRQMAKQLIETGVAPAPGAAMGPCETLNVDGLEFLAEIGAPLTDETGDPMAPIGMLLQGYFRNPPGKHACLEFFEAQDVEFPDTPMTAFHFGRLERLRAFNDEDPTLLERRFTYRDIYPLSLGCHKDLTLGLHGTPLDGTTLLHLCMDFDEVAIADWLLEAGANANSTATVDDDGIGGHTPLFNIVVSQAWSSGRQRDGYLVNRLLNSGADPAHRASIRKGIRFIEDESVHEYKSVTPVEYGRRFHGKPWVSQVALDSIQNFRK